MKPLHSALLIVGIISLGGCSVFDSYNEVNALNNTQAVGSPYTQALANEYRNYANTELISNFDYPDALHFARKGLAAASGENVMPEPLSDWNLNEEHIHDLGAARSRLVSAYSLGSRELAPALSARAQGDFDCWIEQQEERWYNNTPKETSCKGGFTRTIAQLEKTIEDAAAPPAITVAKIQARPVDPIISSIEVVDMTPTKPMSNEEAIYLVFLNWNSTKLGASALNVLDAVAEEIKKHPPQSIQLVGHADTSGASKYNERLAFKRSVEIREALNARGVDPALMSIEGRGEDELLVATQDNVREPANRRVSISFQYDNVPDMVAHNGITQ